MAPPPPPPPPRNKLATDDATDTNLLRTRAQGYKLTLDRQLRCYHFEWGSTKRVSGASSAEHWSVCPHVQSELAYRSLSPFKRDTADAALVAFPSAHNLRAAAAVLKRQTKPVLRR